MNDGGSVVEFFYNIVPGSLFLFFLAIYFRLFDLILRYKDFVIIALFIYFAISLFLGFVFQAIVIYIRHSLGWNETIFNLIKQENKAFEETINSFPKNLNLCEGELKDFFYLMDNKLRADKPSFMPTHFSSLFAFWSNMFCACLISLITIVLFEPYIHHLNFNPLLILTPLIVFLIISLQCSNKFLKSFYDTVLNCYYVKEVLNAGSNKTRR